MKDIFRKFFRFLGFNVTKISSPNPMQPQLHKTIRELRYVLESQLKFLGEEREGEIELISGLDGTQPTEAYYIINSLNEVSGIKGDVCEFGVAQGYTSALIANTIRDMKKVLWLYDSFEGLPMPTEKDELINDIFQLGDIREYHQTMKHSRNSVISQLDRIKFPSKRVKIIPGFIEDLKDLEKFPEYVSFAYIDFDFYEPIKIALEKLNEVLSEGAKVIVDDYGFFSSGVKSAVDEFINENPDRYHFQLPLKSAGKFCILTKRK